MDQSRGAFPRDLTKEPSPSLPKGFPKELIPKNICEQEFMTLCHCIYLYGAEMQCEDEYKGFLRCKRDRDIKLFNAIKKWEGEHFKQLASNQQSMYKQGLQNKLSRLVNEIEFMPSNFWYQNKKNRYESDIEQLKWRLFNLKKIQIQ